MKHFLVAIAGMLIVGSVQMVASAEVDSNTPVDMAGIQRELELQYPLAKTTADGGNIVATGAALVLQKDGLVMSKVYMSGTTRSPPVENVYENSKISQVGLTGFVSNINTFLSTLARIEAQSRSFGRGEKLWVTKITVQTDGIMFQLMSDPLNNMRYHATLKFPAANVVAADQAALMVADVFGTDMPTDAGVSANDQRTSIPGPSAVNPVAWRVVGEAQAQKPSADQSLDSCMRSTMAQGAGVGAAIGGLFGLLTGGDNRGRNAAIGGLIGGVAGGAIAWQGSFQSCSKTLNLATIGSLQTSDYRETAQRYGYSGNGVFLKIEGVRVPPSINAGQILSADLKFVLLTPDAQETDVEVERSFQCGSTQIPVSPERYKIAPGTIESTGKIQLPSLSNSIGQQACSMQMRVAAAGLTQEWRGNFVIIPNQQ